MVLPAPAVAPPIIAALVPATEMPWARLASGPVPEAFTPM